jgi:ribonuclease VapC
VKKKSVLDAYALLAYLNKESGHARVLQLMESEDADLIINSINLGEVFYIIARSHGMRAADYFLSVILPSLPIAVLDNSLENVIEAARLKAGHALSYADCFAASTSIRERVPLVTGDPEFKSLGKLLRIDGVKPTFFSKK